MLLLSIGNIKEDESLLYPGAVVPYVKEITENQSETEAF